MMLVRTLGMLALLAHASAWPAVAQQAERPADRYCLYPAPAASGPSSQPRYMFVDLTRLSGGGPLVSFFSSLAISKPKLMIDDTRGAVSNRIIAVDFVDNWGADGRAQAREIAGGIEFSITRLSPPDSAEPDSHANYGTFKLTKEACARIGPSPSYGHISLADYDMWRYVDDKVKGGAAEYLIQQGPGLAPYVAFRVTCTRPRDLLVDYFFDPGELTESDKKDPLVLGLYEGDGYRPLFANYTLPSTASTDRMSARLQLDEGKLAEIRRAEYVSLDAPNGPSNSFFGGKALAFKRIVRECAG